VSSRIPATGLPRVEVEPGGRFATKEAYEIKTLLGSCVAACLYDESAGVAGMNHFLLAAPRYARALPFTETDAGRYGIHAMELLIADMQKLGAARSRLRAKVFGGASILGNGSCSDPPQDRFFCVSEVNVRFIRDYLAAEGMIAASEDLGGELGRVIHFRTDTFQVYRRFIKKTETVAVEDNERDYWKEAVAKAGPGPAILF
jgi:chemotaxis protein CheD